ncbi:serine protease, partial [uncultured Roseovarius sp.]|uniref:trypsin-like serine peptidase n=1 Tax=uncultured Roseovarius sp. TaxID=293344 RepID=UPI00262406B6
MRLDLTCTTPRRGARAVFRALAIFLLAGVLPAPAPAQAELPMLPFGEAGAWQAIGRVNAGGFKSRRMCSGTLIAPARVLTAAHCLLRRDGTPLAMDRLRFVAGLDRGEYAGLARVAGVALHPEALSAGRVDPRHDLAVLHLTEPLEGIAPIRLGRRGSGPVALIGYHRGRPERLSAGFECPAHRSGGLVRVACPVRAGNSGGPVLVRAGEGWRV